MEDARIRAPFDGVIGLRRVSPGQYIQAGQELTTLVSIDPIKADFQVPERYIGVLETGQQIRISVAAYPDKAFHGEVYFISPEVSVSTRNVLVRAYVANADGLLKPGMFVSAKVQMSKGTSTQSQITVPATAVLWTGSRSLVYVKTNSNEPIFEMRQVTLGTKNGNVYTILEGLNNGEEVVTNGTFTVDAAAQLQGKKSMMNTSGGKTMTGHEGHLGMQEGSTGENADKAIHSEMKERITVSGKFQNQLKQVFKDYILLKDALVNDNAKNAQQAGKQISQSLTKVDMKLLSDEKAHNHWMTIQMEIKASANAIGNSSEIATQRGHFKHLSAHMISSVQLFGVDQEVYIEFCPMADNNKGAYWISLEKEIRNPYYGEAMLTCGEVTETIQ